MLRTAVLAEYSLRQLMCGGFIERICSQGKESAILCEVFLLLNRSTSLNTETVLCACGEEEEK